jgi:hypothetical protein
VSEALHVRTLNASDVAIINSLSYCPINFKRTSGAIYSIGQHRNIRKIMTFRFRRVAVACLDRLSPLLEPILPEATTCGHSCCNHDSD